MKKIKKVNWRGEKPGIKDLRDLNWLLLRTVNKEFFHCSDPGVAFFVTSL